MALVKSQELEFNKKKTLVTQLNTNEDFALLVAEIKKHHTDVEEKKTDAFELEFIAEQGEEGLKKNAIFVSFNNEVIVEAVQELGGLRLKAHFTAKGEKGEKVIRKSIVENGQVVTEFELPFNAAYFSFVEEFKNPTGEVEDIITPEAEWYEGCLSFYNSGDGKRYNYKYCGAKCTGVVGGVKYQATPINPLDSCCRAHDRCWDNFGKNDNLCDYDLYTCANRSYDPGWWMVAQFALSCSKGQLGSVC